MMMDVDVTICIHNTFILFIHTYYLIYLKWKVYQSVQLKYP